MRRHAGIFGLALVLALAGLIPLARPARALTLSFRLWMMGSAASNGQHFCLTQNWHNDPMYDNKALDMKAQCGSVGSENVTFRAKAGELQGTYDGTWNADMYATMSNPSPNPCGLDVVHIGKVKLFGFDAIQRGFMIYAHSHVNSGSQFNILYQKGGTTIGIAKYNSYSIGYTVDDHTAGNSCWTNWHIHENNSDDTTAWWDSWNSKWATAAINCDCYVNNSDSNWIRRHTWSIAE